MSRLSLTRAVFSALLLTCEHKDISVPRFEPLRAALISILRTTEFDTSELDFPRTSSRSALHPPPYHNTTTLANSTAVFLEPGPAACPPPESLQRDDAESVLTTSYLVPFLHLMRNPFPGCLEVIDGPCKYGHYHKGTSHLRPHYSSPTGNGFDTYLPPACGEISRI